MKLMQSMLLILLFSLGVAPMAMATAPIEIENRTEYSTTLNSIACIVMNWYGSLINEHNNNRAITFDKAIVGDVWLSHRTEYPQNITHVVITSTKLRKQEKNGITDINEYQFSAKSLISFMDHGIHKTKIFDETFSFSSKKISQSVIDQISIKAIVTNNSNDTHFTKGKEYDRFHYKVREFTYAWLSYLDGVASLKNSMNAGAWLTTAQYSIEIGTDKKTGLIASVMQHRHKLLAKGGHLLRSLKVSNKTMHKFTLELILEWKGVNPNEKAVLAKIKQIIQIKVNKDKSWEIISINEKHLLPVIAPWMGMLC